MVLTRAFLGFTGLAFVGYGAMCLFDPQVVADASQMAFPNASARTEARAMYGGLQMAVGGLALFGVLRASAARVALATLAILFVGLASGRSVGLVLDGDPASYNLIAFAFEAVSAAIAIFLMRRLGDPAGEPPGVASAA